MCKGNISGEWVIYQIIKDPRAYFFDSYYKKLKTVWGGEGG